MTKNDYWKWRTTLLNSFVAAVNVYGCHKNGIYKITRKCKARRIMRGLKHNRRCAPCLPWWEVDADKESRIIRGLQHGDD